MSLTLTLAPTAVAALLACSSQAAAQSVSGCSGTFDGTWKTNFGMNVLGSGSLSNATVPEPASGWLVILASLIDELSRLDQRRAMWRAAGAAARCVVGRQLSARSGAEPGGHGQAFSTGGKRLPKAS